MVQLIRNPGHREPALTPCSVPLTRKADAFLIVGTSLVVYPAAGLVNYAPFEIPKFVVDKKIPYLSFTQNITGIEKPATEGMKEVVPLLKKLLQ